MSIGFKTFLKFLLKLVIQISTRNILFFTIFIFIFYIIQIWNKVFLSKPFC